MSLDIMLTIEIDTGNKNLYEVILHESNYTHNVVNMWQKANVYDALYNSREQSAGNLIEVLENGIKQMKENPSEFQKMNPSNGWGDYISALDFLIEFTNACKDHPKSVVSLSK